MAWSEPQLGRNSEVKLARRHILIVQPRNGEAVRIGRFGTEQATRVHAATGQFSQATYARESSSGWVFCGTSTN